MKENQNQPVRLLEIDLVTANYLCARLLSVSDIRPRTWKQFIYQAVQEFTESEMDPDDLYNLFAYQKNLRMLCCSGIKPIEEKMAALLSAAWKELPEEWRSLACSSTNDSLIFRVAREIPAELLVPRGFRLRLITLKWEQLNDSSYYFKEERDVKANMDEEQPRLFNSATLQNEGIWTPDKVELYDSPWHLEAVKAILRKQKELPSPESLPEVRICYVSSECADSQKGTWRN